MAVTCPPNTGPGAAVQIQGPSGGMFQVQVPAGVAPGQTFHVQVPLAPPTQTATAMPQQMQQPMMYQQQQPQVVHVHHQQQVYGGYGYGGGYSSGMGVGGGLLGGMMLGSMMFD